MLIEANEMDTSDREEIMATAPERCRKAVAIGDKTYWLYPPTLDEFSQIPTILMSVFKDSEAPQDTVSFIEKVMSSASSEILSIIGISGDLQKKMTFPQLLDLGIKYHELAIGDGILPQETSKKVKALWKTLFPPIPEGRPLAESSPPYSRTKEEKESSSSAERMDSPQNTSGDAT